MVDSGAVKAAMDKRPADGASVEDMENPNSTDCKRPSPLGTPGTLRHGSSVYSAFSRVSCPDPCVWRMSPPDTLHQRVSGCWAPLLRVPA